MSHPHVIPVRTNLVIFAALIGLLALTVGAAYVDLGRLNFAVAMSIAVVKTLLVMLYFMHLRYTGRLTWVFAGAAFVWLAILLTFGLGDYLSRDWLDILGK
jgi:cytochrome c oxidase subunit 4